MRLTAGYGDMVMIYLCGLCLLACVVAPLLALFVGLGLGVILFPSFDTDVGDSAVIVGGARAGGGA